MPLRVISCIITILVAIDVPHSLGQCFFRDGTKDMDASPCPLNINTSMCCWLNETADAIPDICTHQGICISGGNRYRMAPFVDSCQSADWGDGSGCSPIPAACGMYTFA